MRAAGIVTVSTLTRKQERSPMTYLPESRQTRSHTADRTALLLRTSLHGDGRTGHTGSILCPMRQHRSAVVGLRRGSCDIRVKTLRRLRRKHLYSRRRMSRRYRVSIPRLTDSMPNTMRYGRSLTRFLRERRRRIPVCHRRSRSASWMKCLRSANG